MSKEHTHLIPFSLSTIVPGWLWVLLMTKILFRFSFMYRYHEPKSSRRQTIRRSKRCNNHMARPKRNSNRTRSRQTHGAKTKQTAAKPSTTGSSQVQTLETCPPKKLMIFSSTMGHLFESNYSYIKHSSVLVRQQQQQQHQQWQRVEQRLQLSRMTVENNIHCTAYGEVCNSKTESQCPSKFNCKV